MKKLILLILLFVLTIQIVLGICCENVEDPVTHEIIIEGGCYPERYICCEEGDKNIGYKGCNYTLNPELEHEHKCPGIKLGYCLKCSETCQPDEPDCEWDEIQGCYEGSFCLIEYLSGTKIPIITSICTDKCGECKAMDTAEECVDASDDIACNSNDCMPNKYCCKEGKAVADGTKGAVCSSDSDNDGICDCYDNCPNTPNGPDLGTCLPVIDTVTACNNDDACDCSTNQEDEDNDNIGDACDTEEWCYTAYGDRQCCDTLPGVSSGSGAFYGYFVNDCPGPDNGGPESALGCWDECYGTDPEGRTIRYEVGPCIDGLRIIKIIEVLLNPDGTTIGDGAVLETKTEPCSTIPLIPFFTNFNILITFLILFLFYYFKER